MCQLAGLPPVAGQYLIKEVSLPSSCKIHHTSFQRRYRSFHGDPFSTPPPWLIHSPRPLLILARLWAAGESQRSREGTGRVKRAIFLPIGAPDPERLLTLLADWHPVLLVVPPRCWHEGRVRRARGCAGEVRVPALPVRMQGRRDKKLSASQMATGNNAKKNTMSWQRLSDCYTLRVHQ